MDSLGEETWDVVISGTSLSQSLLALALSKCDVKVLHIDRNDYYGGIDAGLSLDEAQTWIERQKTQTDPIDSAKFSITTPASSTTSLGPSRAYTISLKPQIVYARSRILPILVSSQVHTQLEFQAVGSFFVHTDGELQKIPSNREDVFADDNLSVRDKRRLMGLLRYVVDEHDDANTTTGGPATLEAKLRDQFKIPDKLKAPVQALALVTQRPQDTSFDTAIARLKRHFMSMGYFGPGLAAVIAKYGGNSELAQVACRAGAVGGFVYLLGYGINSVETSASEELLQVGLSDGTKIKARRLVGTARDIPEQIISNLDYPHSRSATTKIAHCISVVSNPLRHLFASASENSPTPAAAIILVDDNRPDLAPVYLQVHSEDTGECLTGQCIIYASTTQSDATTQQRLEAAVSSVLETTNTADPASVLWRMTFTTEEATGPSPHVASPKEDNSRRIVVLPERSHDLGFDDSILDNVKAAWEVILGERSSEYDFMRFEERKEENEED